MYEAYVLGSAG